MPPKAFVNLEGIQHACYHEPQLCWDQPVEFLLVMKSSYP